MLQPLDGHLYVPTLTRQASQSCIVTPWQRSVRLEVTTHRYRLRRRRRRLSVADDHDAGCTARAPADRPSRSRSNSPLKQLKAFPQELVLVGRATVMIKGIASVLGLKWNLAARVSMERDDRTKT